MFKVGDKVEFWGPRNRGRGSHLRVFAEVVKVLRVNVDCRGLKHDCQPDKMWRVHPTRIVSVNGVANQFYEPTISEVGYVGWRG